MDFKLKDIAQTGSSVRIVAVLLLVALAISTYFRGEQPGSECVRLKVLGEDSEKLNKLKQWFVDNWGDASFADIFRYSSHVHALGNSELFARIDLNWEYYGIREEFGSMTISRSRDDSGKPNWFTIGEIRSALFVELSNTGVLANRAGKRDWVNVGDGVYLICE